MAGGLQEAGPQGGRLLTHQQGYTPGLAKHEGRCPNFQYFRLKNIIHTGFGCKEKAGGLVRRPDRCALAVPLGFVSKVQVCSHLKGTDQVAMEN